MKNILTSILVLAMLASLTACGGNNSAPVTTTATAETETAMTTTVGEGSALPPETTAPVDIDSMLEGYALHKMVSDELESFRETFPEDSALGKIAIEVTDYDELYLLIEDEGITENNDGGYDRAKVRRVICGNTVQDCDITFAFGPYRFDLIKTDEYTVVGNQGYSSHFIVFGEDSCGEIPFNYGRDGACPWLKEENGQLCYRIENPIITKTFGDLRKILDTVTSEDEWRYEWGTVTLDGNNVILTKTKEQSMREEGFLRDLFIPGGQFKTLEELLEYNRLKAEKGDAEAFLTTIPVYEYSYADVRHFDEFDRIGGAEYEKFAAGEDFDEYYGIRITEYPDIVLVGRVVTEADKTSVYDMRLMDSVIRNGERHYLPDDAYGPGFSVHVTEDFVCVVMAASGIGGMYYVYDGGLEYHTPSNIVSEGQLAYISEQSGTVGYRIYSKKYAGMVHSNDPLAYGDLKADDHFYDTGTVQLVDGKIKYVADISYTIGEWFENGPKQNTGCNTLEEYQEYLRNEIESMIN